MNTWSGAGTLKLNKIAARQVAEELAFACKQMDSSEWCRIILKCSGRASSDTVVSKYNQVRNLGKIAYSTGQRYKRNGIRASAHDDVEWVGDCLKNLPSRVRSCISIFRAMTAKQQTDQVVDLILMWIIFWASAGGSDWEGGLPDTDLLLGIGEHRNILSHTLLLGLGTEMALRAGIELFQEVYGKLPINHSRAWDTSLAFLQSHKSASINAMWAGIGAHFVKDANLLTEATKPYAGLPVPLPIDAHQALFAANGAACEVAALVKDD